MMNLCYNKDHRSLPTFGGIAPYAGELFLHAPLPYHITNDTASILTTEAQDFACDELLALQSRTRALLLLCYYLRIEVWQEHGKVGWLFALECSRSDMIRLLNSTHKTDTAADTDTGTTAAEGNDSVGFWSGEYRRLITPTRPMVIPHPDAISRAEDQRMGSLWAWRDAKARQLDLAPVNALACAEVVRLAIRNPRNSTELITCCSPLSAVVLAYHEEVLASSLSQKATKMTTAAVLELLKPRA